MKLRSAAAAATAMLALCAPASFANAGIYTDDLAKCLVKSTSADDQTALVVWIYGGLSLHPAIKAYSNMTEAQHEEVLKRAGHLFERLLTADCRAEAVSALKYEGASAFENSFKVLGEVAMRNLMGDPHVGGGLDIQKYVDMSKIEQLGKEAGAAGSK